MRKFCVVLAVVLVLLSFGAASAEGEWYALTDDDCALQVELAANATTGYAWRYQISDENILKIESEDYIADESDADGVGGVWKAKFASADGAGKVELTLEYVSPAGEIDSGYTVSLFVSENGQMSVEDVAPYWVFVSNNNEVMTVRLEANATTGFEWIYATAENEGVELLTSEYVEDEHAEDMVGVGGTWIASFRASEGFTGETGLMFLYTSGDEIAQTRTVTIEVAEDKTLAVTDFAIIQPE